MKDARSGCRPVQKSITSISCATVPSTNSIDFGPVIDFIPGALSSLEN